MTSRNGAKTPTAQAKAETVLTQVPKIAAEQAAIRAEIARLATLIDALCQVVGYESAAERVERLRRARDALSP